jgi:hypothetical protein
MKSTNDLQEELKKQFSTNKIILIILVIVGLCAASFAQTPINFGVKGGLNYNSNENLEFKTEYNFLYIEESRGRVGFHVGAWARKEIASLPLYVQPEFLYTQTKSTYIDFDRSDYTSTKLEAPILVGTKVFKMLNIFAGPDFQFIIDSNFGNAAKVNTDSFSLAVHMGLGIDIGNLGLDIRWEKGLSKSYSSVSNDFFIIDSRANQLICSLKYQLNN